MGGIIAKKMGWGFIPELLLKRNNGEDFKINPKYQNNIIRQVILFDDTLKTGNTLLTASKALSEWGVERILCLVIAN